MKVTIKINDEETDNLLIRDMGIFIPPGKHGATFTDSYDLELIKRSKDLQQFVSDQVVSIYLDGKKIKSIDLYSGLAEPSIGKRFKHFLYACLIGQVIVDILILHQLI